MSLNGVMPGRSFSTTLDDTKKSLQSLSDGLKQAQERQRQFNQSLERFGTVSSQAISRIAQATSRLNKSLHELETNQERLRRNKSSKETPSKETSGKSQSELASDFKTKREQFGFVMKPVVASVTHYASFEAQLRSISIAHDISSEQEKLMGQQLRQSSQRVNQTPDALLGSAGKLLERGMSKEQIKGVTDLTEVLGKTSMASGAALTDLTALSVTLDNVFNLKGAEVQQESLSRMLAGTKQGFSTALMAQYVPALASGFTAMGATGNQALSQLVSSLSATKGGDTEANTVARLESFMNAVGRTDIADSYGKAGVNYNALLKSHMKDGYSQYDAAVLIGNQLIDSKGSQFQKRWDMAAGNVDAQQSLMQRYGLQEVFRTPEAVNHAMSMKQNWQSYQANQQVMNSPAATQTLELDFARQNGTLTARWNRMTTSLLNIALNVGEALTPVLVSLSDALIPILDQLVTWTAANPELVRGIVMAVAGFFAFRMALSGAKLGMDILLPSLQSVWKGIQQGWQWLKGLNPKGLWRGILQGWQWLKAGLNLNSLWQGIRAALSGLGSSAGILLGRILSSVMSSGFMMVVRVVLLLGGILLTLPAELIVGIGVAIAGLFALIYKYSDQIAELWNKFVSTISDFFNSPMETVSNAIPDGVKNFFGFGPSEGLIANNNQAAAVLAPTPVSALSLEPTPRIESPKAENTASTPQQRVALTPTVGGAKGKLVSAAPSERVQVAFSPTIYLNGQKATPTPEMTKTLTLSMNELENMLNKLLTQRERRGYA
ncbi:phage tail tape measure protein [Pectobacterium brasiliense]|uniref:Phage tail tape measure protein n=1 Tax=Pectobacterium brasiliense TaxID=180957 RepID=A0A3S0ZW87_9GAMM|nr:MULTISPECIES: phage tail tape measure protein [Pectobacterium]GKW27054.1 phage tail tape measure protein [Pectobacterium carotovorum subsp. carotovorum]MBN3047674.1 phage tail tape measure protein [Pectobacterium brasiliense]MBN3076840.1 phage tail tape measure protein [Pectobacterium brasiliense]MBN3084316.1 phage tail tape measure protein [Pectobacterium brasiliense]MBN3088579.1 phage tail tape measure protein [Pectobacterium brasiliense]